MRFLQGRVRWGRRHALSLPNPVGHSVRRSRPCTGRKGRAPTVVVIPRDQKLGPPAREPTLPQKTREGWGNPVGNLDSERMGQPPCQTSSGGSGGGGGSASAGTKAKPKPPANPSDSPGSGWEWRGKGPVGSSQGSWYNPSTGESLHPDLGHPDPIGPHWDYIDSAGNQWRLYPDGRALPK